MLLSATKIMQTLHVSRLETSTLELAGRRELNSSSDDIQKTTEI